jgi:hypothetical protein
MHPLTNAVLGCSLHQHRSAISLADMHGTRVKAGKHANMQDKESADYWKRAPQLRVLNDHFLAWSSNHPWYVHTLSTTVCN